MWGNALEFKAVVDKLSMNPPADRYDEVLRRQMQKLSHYQSRPHSELYNNCFFILP